MTGSRRYSADLPQGGLEIPCKLIFTGISKHIEKVKKLIKFATRDGEPTTESPSSSIKVTESSTTTVNVAQCPSTSITVAESSGTTVTVAQSPSTSITAAESSGTIVDVARSPSTSITVAESSGTTVDVAQSPCALIKVTKSPDTTVKVPSSSTKVTESSVPLITVSKPASSFEVVDSSTIIIDAAHITPSETSSAIKIENTQLLGSHCKRFSSQTNQRGKN